MRTLLLLAAALTASPAAAEVKSVSPNAFEIEDKATVALTPEQLYARVGQIGQWWNKDHSYSGDAANLSLELRPGGCFCEKLANGGGVEHLRVAHVDPGKRIVLVGALGPLLFEAVSGVMDIRIVSSGNGSALTLNYRVAGFAKGGADKLAPAVDKVLGEQIRRLATLPR